MITFTTKLSILKLELKSKVKKLKHHKKLPEYKRIDNQFFYNLKKVYWLMKEDDISIENISMKESVESSWKGIWEEGTTFKNKADWLPQLEIMYCNKVTATEYNINRTILDKVIQKLQINKVLGNDHITGYWYKHLTTYRDQLTDLFQHQIHSDQPLSYCHQLKLRTLTLRKKILSYCVLCFNVMYKLYTSGTNKFLVGHVHKNNIINQEQGAGNKGVREKVEQLFINKSIVKEAWPMHRNLVTVWLDYRKAFGSIPHNCLLEAFKLAKIP